MSGTDMGWGRMGAAPGEMTMVTLGKGWCELPERQELQQMWGKAVPWQGQRDNTGQSTASLGQEVVAALGYQAGTRSRASTAAP